MAQVERSVGLSAVAHRNDTPFVSSASFRGRRYRVALPLQARLGLPIICTTRDFHCQDEGEVLGARAVCGNDSSSAASAAHDAGSTKCSVREKLSASVVQQSGTAAAAAIACSGAAAPRAKRGRSRVVQYATTTNVNPYDRLDHLPWKPPHSPRRRKHPTRTAKTEQTQAAQLLVFPPSSVVVRCGRGIREH